MRAYAVPICANTMCYVLDMKKKIIWVTVTVLISLSVTTPAYGEDSVCPPGYTDRSVSGMSFCNAGGNSSTSVPASFAWHEYSLHVEELQSLNVPTNVEQRPSSVPQYDPPPLDGVPEHMRDKIARHKRATESLFHFICQSTFGENVQYSDSGGACWSGD